MNGDSAHCLLCGTLVPASADGTYKLRFSCPVCGRYAIDGVGDRWNPDISAFQRRLGERLLPFRWLVRKQSDEGNPVLITRSNLEELPKAATPRASALEPMDYILGAFATQLHSIAQHLQIDPRTQFLAYRTESEEELNKVVMFMRDELKLVRNASGMPGWSLDPTAEGWQRIAALRIAPLRRDTVFVAMWFTPDMETAWTDGIRPALKEDCHYGEPIRIDRTHFEGKIDDEILANIRRSGLLVADFSGGRGGVYFEAGFAMGLGIPVVWTCRGDWFDRAGGHDGVHFDTNHYPFIVWETPANLRKQLADRVNALYPRPTR